MYTEIKGNLLEADVDIIAHQVNCKGAYGAGIALQINNKYPITTKKYKKFVAETREEELLGQCQIVPTEVDGKQVANLFGQLRYGTGRRQTNYKALENALFQLKDYAEQNNLSVGVPYGIGCGLAGGGWDIVERIIKDVFNDYPITVVRLR